MTRGNADSPQTVQSAIDLFAGPGGWDTAAALLGIQPLGIEWDAAAVDTAEAYGHRRWQADVAQLYPWDFSELWTGGHLDLLIASPPCQAFSMAGKGKGRAGAQVILDGVDAIGSGQDPRRVIEHVDSLMGDPRAALVLEPLRWALDLEPTFLAWEQVPAVLPLWEAMADVLRADGYSVATGNLQAEQYDVPQTRKRAILVASRARDVALPAPVRRKYRKGIPQDGAIKGQEGLLPWLSMADALGWVAGELVGFPRRADTPSNGAGDDIVTLDGTDYRGRDLHPVADRPAPVLTEKCRSWQRWQMTSGTRPNAAARRADEPSPTLALGHDAASYCITPAGVSPDQLVEHKRNSPVRDAWTGERPATTVQGDPRLPAPGHRCMTPDCHPGREPESMMTKSVRVTVQEAAALQGFPADYPWQGTKTAQYRQVGDAVPPPLAWHVLRAALGMTVEAWPHIAGSPRQAEATA